MSIDFVHNMSLAEFNSCAAQGELFHRASFARSDEVSTNLASEIPVPYRQKGPSQTAKEPAICNCAE